MPDPTDFKIPFGKHKGEMISQIPMNYLDWLVGWMEDTTSDREPGKKMMEVFPSVYRGIINHLEKNKYGMGSETVDL